MDRLSTMSPAARRLATQKLKIIGTPTPRRNSRSRTPSIGVRTPGTPGILTSGKSQQSSQVDAKAKTVSTTQEPVSTDNLLKLPIQRQRASDFFNN